MKKKRLSIWMLTLFAATLVSVSVLPALAEGSVDQPSAVALDRLGTYTFAPNQFGYWYKNSSWRKDSATEMIHKTGWADLAASKTQDGEYFIQFTVPENYTNASKNGFLKVSASADVHSEDTGSINFDTPETITMYLENGTYSGLKVGDFTASGASQSGAKTCESYENISLSLDNGIEGNGLRLRFRTSVNAYAGSNVMYVRNPQITLSTTDSAAPAISYSIAPSPDGFYNKNKVLTVTVKDEQSGVDYLEVNGKKIVSGKSEDTKELVYSVEIPDNGVSFSLKAVDNVGNASGTTTTETVSGIDKTAPESPKVTFSEDIGGWIHTNDLSVRIDWTASEGVSPEKVVYTLDGSAPTYASSELTAGENPLHVANGEYHLQIAAVDAAGNVSEVQSFPLKVDSNDYHIVTNPPIEGGILVCDTATAKRGDKITVHYDVKEGFRFYRLLLNGEEQTPESGSFTFEVSGDMVTELKVRKVLSAELEKSTYTYGGSVISPLLTSNIAFEELTVTAYFVREDGTEVESEIVNAGTYRLHVAVDTEQYIGEKDFTLTVAKLKMSVEAAGTSVVYDGLPHRPEVKSPVESLTYSVTLTGAPEEGATDAGEYAYRIEIVSDNIEGECQGVFVVEKRKVTVAVSSPETVYGESLETPVCTVEGALDSEPLAFDWECSALFGENAPAYPAAGQYALNILRRPELTNYEIDYRDGTYTVAKRKIRVQADEGQGKAFGEPDDPELTGTITDLVSENGEIPAYLDPLKVTFVRMGGEAAGDYPILLAETAEDNPNYEIQYIGADFNIRGRKIVIMALDVTTEYGEPYSFSGKDYQVFGELLEGQPLDGALERAPGNGVGKYEIVLGTLGNPYYEITFFGATFEITPRRVTVTADAVSKTYGEIDPELTYACDRLVEGDGFSGGLTREPGEHAGFYAVSLGTLANPNYEIEFVGADFTIEKRRVTVTADAVSKTYGESDPELTFACEGLLPADALTGALAREPGEIVGTYALLLGTLSHADYEIEFVSAAFTVEKRTLIVTVTPGQGKTYGEEDGELTYTAEGLLEGDDPGFALEREPGEGAGTYRVTLSGEGNPNYDLQFESGEYTIYKADLSLNLQDTEIVYDGEAHVSLDCMLPEGVEIAFSFRNKLTGEVTDSVTDAGVYFVTATVAESANYNAAQSDRIELTIRPRSVFFTLEQDTFMFDGTEKFPVFAANEEVGTIVTFEGGSAPVEPGSYPFTVTADNENYAGEYKGILTILPLPAVEEGESSVEYVSGDPLTGTPAVAFDASSEVRKEDNAALEKNEKKRNVLGRITLENAPDFGTTLRVRVAVSNLSDYKNLILYAVDETGGIREVLVTIEDGFISFETEGGTSRFVLTDDRSSNWGTWAIAGGGGLAAVGAAAFLVFKVKAKAI